MGRTSLRIVFLVIALVMVGTIGCTPCAKVRLALHDSADEPAAKFAVSAISVGSWDTYRDRLQPIFKADAQALLAGVVPTTSRSEFKQVDGVSVGVDISAPSDEFTLKNLVGDEALESGGNSAFPSAKELPGLGALGNLDLDPMTMYQLTSSLYQEIQMLNAYVRDAAIPAGYRAYVARLNLGVMVYRRNEPLDLYATISFFDEYEKRNSSSPGARAQADTLVARAEVVTSRKHVRVLPMIATDSIEAALRSQSMNRIRDLALRLSGGVGSVGGAAEFNRRMDRLESVLGRDMNSTFQVFHETENSVVVRIGAVNSAMSERSLVGRTFPITVLLLVPDDVWRPVDSNENDGLIKYPVVNIRAKMSLRHSNTGIEQPMPGIGASVAGALSKLEQFESLTQDVDKLCANLADHAASKSIEESDLVRLLLAINTNSWDEFKGILDCNHSTLTKFDKEVWMSLLEGVGETGFSWSSLTLATDPMPTWTACETELPVLVDDGKSSRVSLGGFSNLLDPAKLKAELFIDGKVLLQTSAAVSDAGSTLTLAFDSPKRLGLPKNEMSSAVRVSWWDDSSSTPEWKIIPACSRPNCDSPGERKIAVAEVPASAEKPPYEIVQHVKTIPAAKGQAGSIRFTLKRDKSIAIADSSKIGVRVKGAEARGVDAPSSALFELTGNDVLQKKGVALPAIGDRWDVVLTIENFHHEKEIEIEFLVDGKAVGESVKYTVKPVS